MIEPADDQKRQIRSVDDLIAILSAITADGQEIWYRGHRDSGWLLQASVFRKREFWLNEREMLARFHQEAAAAGLPYSFDEWGWITFAQHHMLPTRLLDWSQSPLVALFFACERGDPNREQKAEPDGEFFALHPNLLNCDAGDNDSGAPRLLSDGDDKLKDYFPGRDGANSSKPRAVIAPMAFDRIRFQTGTFTIEQRPVDALVEDPIRNSRALESYIVPSAFKDKIRTQIEALGFSEASIYRDLDRIAVRIRKTSERSGV
ncbi:FRG domain-containing protein [Propionibacterium freudenreichii]|uniref:FRG domain-containing protein n=1 Tax=Propionibacterium freudenreichii TaxID=1744 RepID=UPI0018AFACC4|nr:FRG domain-containing protein [Propionibacterium freudenreichii]